MAPHQEPHCDRDQLAALLAGHLDPASEAAVDRHLDECPACRDALEALAAGREWWADLRHLDGGATVAEAPEAARDGLAGLLEPTTEPGMVGRLGPYEIAGVLGRGGMGVVLQGFDPVLHRPVAIKVIAPELAASASARRRFAREARAATAVAHEHVVAIHAVAESAGGLPYLVMPYVAGKSLQERIDGDGPLGVAEILRIGMQAAAGLAGAHAQGLVHRDIKPANILLENGVERVKITDFGLARVVDDASLSQSGVIAGTPEYMSPEQARGEAVDARSDLFSLGAVLYAMATGHPPFRAGNPLAILRRICDDPPRPVREINAEIPPWLAAIIAQLLAKNPADRFGSATEVSQLLAHHLAEVQQPGWKEPTVIAPRRRARRPLVAAGVLAVALVGLGLAEAAGVHPVAALVATIIRIATPEGTLVIEVDDPAVKVALDGRDLVITGGGPQEVRVRLGEHRVVATRAGTPVREEVVTITRDNRPTVVVRRESPPPAAPTPPPAPAVAAVTPPEPPPPARPAPVPPAVDPKEGTVITYPRWYRPEPAKPEAARSATVVAGPVVPGLDQAEALRPVALDDASPVPLWPGSSVTYQAYSPDGTTLALASNFPREVLLIDAATRQRKGVLTGHSARVWTLAFAPDGRHLAMATGDWGSPARSGKVHLWDLDKPTAPTVVAQDIPLAFAVAFSPDGKTLAYGGWGDAIALYDIAAGRVRATCLGHTDNARFLAYSPDGSILASASWDKTVRFWDPGTGSQQGEPIGPAVHAVNSLSFSPDGKLLAGAVHGSKPTEDPQLLDRVVVWDVATRAVRAELIGHSRVVFFAAFSPDGRTLASSGGLKDVFGEVKLWDTSTWQERRTLGGFRSWIGCVAFAPDGRTLVAASDHGGQRAEVRAWDLTPPFAAAPGPIRPDGSPIWALAFTPDGRSLAIGAGLYTRHGRVWLRDLASGRATAVHQALLAVRSLAYSGDGTRLVVGSFDGALAVGDGSGQNWRTIPAHDAVVNAVAVTPGGKLVASAARDGTVKLFNTGDLKLIATLNSGEAWSLAFTPDGATLAAGMKGGSIGFYDLATRQWRFTGGSHTLGVSALAFAPDGKTLASASWDGTIQLRDAFDAGAPVTLTGHDRPIRALAFSPDGRTLASADGAEDKPETPGVVRLWDVPGGHPRGVFRDAKARLWAVAFAPDGRSFAAGGEDGVVTLWTRDDPAGR